MQGEGRRAAVIGGSLGGLTAANLLRDDGWDVTVYEKSAVPLDGRGAGIVVHASTVRYLLERMGLEIDAISCPSSALRYFAPDGSIVHEQPSTYRFTAWNTLHRNLLAGIRDRHVLGHAMCGIDTAGDGPVELRFANGVVEHADLVVAADGFDSTVRRRLFGTVAARYSGYVGWRGVVVGDGFGDAARRRHDPVDVLRRHGWRWRARARGLAFHRVARRLGSAGRRLRRQRLAAARRAVPARLLDGDLRRRRDACLRDRLR